MSVVSMDTFSLATQQTSRHDLSNDWLLLAMVSEAKGFNPLLRFIIGGANPFAHPSRTQNTFQTFLIYSLNSIENLM